jgi:hypothetical protein
MASDEYVRKFHGKMFDQTWKWASGYRRTEKTSEFHSTKFKRERLMALFGDVSLWD